MRSAVFELFNCCCCCCCWWSPMTLMALIVDKSPGQSGSTRSHWLLAVELRNVSRLMLGFLASLLSIMFWLFFSFRNTERESIFKFGFNNKICQRFRDVLLFYSLYYPSSNLLTLLIQFNYKLKAHLFLFLFFFSICVFFCQIWKSKFNTEPVYTN